MGYSAAIFGQMADSVVAVEGDEAIAADASALLSELEVDNVAVVVGEPGKGLEKQGPYDVIFFDGSTSIDVSQLSEQLSDGGRFGVFMQDGPVSRGTVYTKAGEQVTSRVVFDASVAALPGFHGEIEFQL
jgi:protein-L-isoaspartate(D-aspartate) O-methyltransferase